MPNNGVMKEISSLLAQDKSSTEIIALGFKPSTVYKTQRLIRQQVKNGHLKQSLGGYATSAQYHGEPAQTLNQMLKPEVMDRREEASRLKQENQLLQQKVESLSSYLDQEPYKLVDPIKEEKPSTTPKTLENEEIPTEQPSSNFSSYHSTLGMSTSDKGHERERKSNGAVRVLSPRNAAIGTCSFLFVSLGILLIVPVSNYDLAVSAYSFLYPSNPDRAVSFLQWWQQWSIPLEGFLTVSGAVSAFFLAFLGYRQNRKGQQE